MSDIDTAAADSLKVLDPERPIREADMLCPSVHRRNGPEGDIALGKTTVPDRSARTQRRLPISQFGAMMNRIRLRASITINSPLRSESNLV